MCWLASVIGHYAWMNSWMQIVKERENVFFGINSSQQPNDVSVSSEIFVYAKVIRKPKQSVVNNMLPKFISTQKVTKWFVWSIILAWIASSVFLWRFTDCPLWLIAPTVFSLFTVLIGYFLYKKSHKWYSSEYLDIV